MFGSVGYWGSGTFGGMAVGWTTEMIQWLDAQGTDRRVFVSVSKERRVICLPDAEGGHVSSVGSSNGTPFRYVSADDHGASLFLDIDLPPFALHEVEFVEEEGCLSAPLADDHELPWPQLRMDCTTYDAEKLALEALQARLNSLLASGLTSFRPEHRMPQRLHRLLPRGAYMECVRTAKTLSGLTL